MSKNIIDKMKNVFKGEKKVENIVLVIILLVILLISMNFIFSSTDNKEKTTKENASDMNNTTSNKNINSSEIKDELELKLTNILNKISGITDASVMVSYSSDIKKIPVYDVKQQENVSKDDTKTTTQKTVEKNVAYEDVNGKKTAIVESNEMPIVEGVIVVASGIYGEELKNKVISAVSAVTNVPLHKVQVFEKGVK